jgi:hypothetical protein
MLGDYPTTGCHLPCRVVAGGTDLAGASMLLTSDMLSTSFGRRPSRYSFPCIAIVRTAMGQNLVANMNLILRTERLLDSNSSWEWVMLKTSLLLAHRLS